MKPVMTEKAVTKIELENLMIFIVDKRKTKLEIKKEAETLLDAKIDKVKTLIRNNKKYAYVKLNEKNPAIDVATKMGLM